MKVTKVTPRTTLTKIINLYFTKSRPRRHLRRFLSSLMSRPGLFQRPPLTKITNRIFRIFLLTNRRRSEHYIKITRISRAQHDRNFDEYLLILMFSSREKIDQHDYFPRKSRTLFFIFSFFIIILKEKSTSEARFI